MAKVVSALLALCMMALTGFVARQEFLSVHVAEVDKRVTTVEANYVHIKEDMIELKQGQSELKALILNRR